MATITTVVETEQFLDDPRFSQSFELPADPQHGRDKPLNVTYADFGYRDEAHPETERVLFFFPGMFASRWLLVAKDHVAKQAGVRIVTLDRPGFGGTTTVSPEKRLEVCRELVPALLKHLGIETVSFACHSGGTLFAMDMLLHHPELLDPRFPYIALAGPWIHTSHTGVVSLSMAKALPSGLVAQFDKVVGFVHNHLESWTSTSFGISEPIANLFATPPSGGIEDESVTFEENTMAKALDRAHKENIEGVSSEALVLLRNIKGMDGWGDWGDYDELIRRVGNAFREAGRKLTIDVFYAETDSMIGLETAKGAQWFDNCWRAGGDTLEYSRRVVKGTDHNSLWQLRWGVPQLVFAKLGGRNGSEQPTAS